MARLVGVFVTLVLLMLGASLIVGHFRQQAVLGQLAEINRGVTNKSIEHRSVSARTDRQRHWSQARASQKHEFPVSGRTHTSPFNAEGALDHANWTGIEITALQINRCPHTPEEILFCL